MKGYAKDDPQCNGQRDLFRRYALGVLVYAVYDMTNYSLVRDWPLRVALIDICWGSVLNAIGTLAADLLDR